MQYDYHVRNFRANERRRAELARRDRARERTLLRLQHERMCDFWQQHDVPHREDGTPIVPVGDGTNRSKPVAFVNPNWGASIGERYHERNYSTGAKPRKQRKKRAKKRKPKKRTTTVDTGPTPAELQREKRKRLQKIGNNNDTSDRW